MLPSISKSQQITQHLHLNPSLKSLVPRVNNKKVWNEDYQLLSFSSPQMIQSLKSKKIFKLRFLYRKKGEMKKHSHVIYFGEKDDYIFSHDKNNRVKKILKMKNLQNPFHCDYWSAHLANKYQTLNEGLSKFNQYFIQQTKEFIKKKQENNALKFKG